jgi:predicted ATP-grasp superfamily ATP-dependent carboligase
VAPSLHVTAQPEPRDPTLVLAFEGWNDAGEAASVAARYLADALQAADLAQLDPESYYDFTVNRPQVRLVGGERRIEWQTFSLRAGAALDGRPLVVGVGPEPHLRWRAFCDELAGFVRGLGVRRAMLLGAFLADVVYSRPVRVTGFASDPQLAERLGLEPSGYEGPTGIVGVLAERLRADGVEVVSFWASLPHYIEASPNPRGALALVQKSASYLGMPFDETPLRSAAAEFEERISALVAADPALSEYVRALKKREFAQ